MLHYSVAAVERDTKVQEVILRTVARKITWIKAAEIIGVTPRHHIRRWQEKYEEFGLRALFDGRRGKSSPRRVSEAGVDEGAGAAAGGGGLQHPRDRVSHLKQCARYKELGRDYFDRQNTERLRRHLVRKCFGAKSNLTRFVHSCRLQYCRFIQFSDRPVYFGRVIDA